MTGKKRGKIRGFPNRIKTDHEYLLDRTISKLDDRFWTLLSRTPPGAKGPDATMQSFLGRIFDFEVETESEAKYLRKNWREKIRNYQRRGMSLRRRRPEDKKGWIIFVTEDGCKVMFPKIQGLIVLELQELNHRRVMDEYEKVKQIDGLREELQGRREWSFCERVWIVRRVLNDGKWMTITQILKKLGLYTHWPHVRSTYLRYRRALQAMENCEIVESRRQSQIREWQLADSEKKRKQEGNQKREYTTENDEKGGSKSDNINSDPKTQTGLSSLLKFSHPPTATDLVLGRKVKTKSKLSIL